jgi:3-oxoadipate enol-lactonase
MISKHLTLKGSGATLAVHVDGNERGPAVLLAHSILASHVMWDEQARLLADRGFHVLRMDTRGHGLSGAPTPPYVMADLVADVVSVLDQLDLDTVHYVGLSLGGMTGFGLGILHPHRLKSLLLCDARADAPVAFAAPWDDRIQTAQQHGCAALAESTAERWFGRSFLDSQPQEAARVRAMIAATSTAGFVGCARAIQGLGYLGDLATIDVPTTLLVGANDGPLPAAMKDVQGLIAESRYELIADAGHLPNIDQPKAFGEALLRHLERNAKR